MDALSAFESDPDRYALVLTDLTMPKLTGIELAQVQAKLGQLVEARRTAYMRRFTQCERAP